MSTSQGIAAVTATLQDLLQNGFNNSSLSVTVTSGPPDRARADATAGNQLNLFLYQIMPNAAWRNMDIPRQAATGAESPRSVPPLALNLNYILSAFASSPTSDVEAQLILGQAMATLHDQPLLDRDRILNISTADLKGNALDRQVENVRLTLHPLQLDDIFKLWSGFQTQYRLSVAYEATVVLIDSATPPRTALPVLSRGVNDQGVNTVPGPGPTLDSILLPAFPNDGRANPIRLPAARLDEPLIFVGEGLSSDTVAVQFNRLSALSPDQFSVTPTADPAGLSVVPDSTLAPWRAGFYSACIVLTPNTGPAMASNALPFGLAPRFTLAALTVARTGNSATINLTCDPPVDSTQQVALLLNQLKVAQPHDTTVTATLPAGSSTQLSFVVPNAIPGTFLVRLQVDGVTSIPIDTTSNPPQRKFDGNQQVTIQ